MGLVQVYAGQFCEGHGFFMRERRNKVGPFNIKTGSRMAISLFFLASSWTPLKAFMVLSV